MSLLMLPNTTQREMGAACGAHSGSESAETEELREQAVVRDEL